jgi:hypothetical protein
LRDKFCLNSFFAFKFCNEVVFIHPIIINLTLKSEQLLAPPDSTWATWWNYFIFRKKIELMTKKRDGPSIRAICWAGIQVIFVIDDKFVIKRD